MLNDHAVQERDEFINDHSPYVRVEGFLLFIDGSVVEDNPLGRLIPPPDDDHERLQNICRYWQIAAEQDEQAFQNYKDYLNGSGKREPLWATFYTEEERIGHLKMLQVQAKRTKAKYFKAKRDADDATPFWQVEREQVEIDESKRNQEFLSKIDSINL